MMKPIYIAFLVLFVGMAGAQNPAPASKPAAAAPLLPQSFAGWKQTAIQSSKDPAHADPANAALLKELGFSDAEQAAYQRGGRQLKLTAVRFADAGGALGAFSFYREPNAIPEQVGDEAISLPAQTELFRRGNILVQARFDQLTAMSASELRELAAELPRAQGSQASLPPLPNYLPKDDQVKNSLRYFVGPAGLEKTGAGDLAPLIAFERNPELAAAQYTLSDRKEQLLVISYPTPQVAAERKRAFESSGAQPQLYVRQSGPLLAIARGEASERQAHSLLSDVNYDANVTWNEPTFLGKKENIGLLILGIAALIGVLLLIALLSGFAFGGTRVLLARIFPGRVAARSDEAEIIRLKIEENR
jgi:hypothetical protein